MTKTKKLLAVVVIAVAGYAVWNLRSNEQAVAKAEANLVFDRIWIDHMPEDEKDMINIFAALTEQPIGIFQAMSAWKGNHELFEHESHGNEIRIVYGQTGEREQVKAVGTKCEPDNGMDFCLEIEGASRGVKRYYSLEGWELDGAASADDIRVRLRALVKAAK